MNYPIIIYPCEEGGFVAEIPAITDGKRFMVRNSPKI